MNLDDLLVLFSFLKNTGTVDFDHHIKLVLRLYKKKGGGRKRSRERGRKEGKGRRKRKRGRKAIESPRYNKKELSEQDILEPGFLRLDYRLEKNLSIGTQKTKHYSDSLGLV